MTSLNIYREIDVYWRIATGVCHYVGGTDEGLSLAITEWVTLRIVKKLHAEGCTRCAVQTALNMGAATTTND